MLASGTAISDSLVYGKLEDDSEDRGSSRIGTALSCKKFLRLFALFLLQVASMSKSKSTKSPAKDLRRIQSTSKKSG